MEVIEEKKNGQGLEKKTHREKALEAHINPILHSKACFISKKHLIYQLR